MANDNTVEIPLSNGPDFKVETGAGIFLPSWFTRLLPNLSFPVKPLAFNVDGQSSFAGVAIDVVTSGADLAESIGLNSEQANRFGLGRATPDWLDVSTTFASQNRSDIPGYPNWLQYTSFTVQSPKIIELLNSKLTNVIPSLEFKVDSAKVTGETKRHTFRQVGDGSTIEGSWVPGATAEAGTWYDSENSSFTAELNIGTIEELTVAGVQLSDVGRVQVTFDQRSVMEAGTGVYLGYNQISIKVLGGPDGSITLYETKLDPENIHALDAKTGKAYAVSFDKENQKFIINQGEAVEASPDGWFNDQIIEFSNGRIERDKATGSLFAYDANGKLTEARWKDVNGVEHRYSQKDNGEAILEVNPKPYEGQAASLDTIRMEINSNIGSISDVTIGAIFDQQRTSLLQSLQSDEAKATLARNAISVIAHSIKSNLATQHHQALLDAVGFSPELIKTVSGLNAKNVEPLYDANGNAIGWKEIANGGDERHVFVEEKEVEVNGNQVTVTSVIEKQKAISGIELVTTTDEFGNKQYNAVLGSSNIDVGQLGSIFGSTLGRQLGGNSIIGQAITGTLAGTITDNLVETAVFSFVDGETFSSAVDKAFDDFGQNLATASVGAVSSLLTAELVNALGIDGVAGEVANVVGGTAIGTVADNFVFKGELSFDGLEGINVANALGSFIGGKLAAEAVTPISLEEQLGASIGSAALGLVGTKVGAKLGTTIGGPLGAAIGAFAGFIVGKFVVDTFQDYSPDSGAHVYYDSTSGMFKTLSDHQTITVNGTEYRNWKDNDGDPKTARYLADNATAVFNSVLTGFESTGATLRETDILGGASWGQHNTENEVENGIANKYVFRYDGDNKGATGSGPAGSADNNSRRRQAFNSNGTSTLSDDIYVGGGGHDTLSDLLTGPLTGKKLKMQRVDQKIELGGA